MLAPWPPCAVGSTTATFDSTHQATESAVHVLVRMRHRWRNVNISPRQVGGQRDPDESGPREVSGTALGLPLDPESGCAYTMSELMLPSAYITLCPCCCCMQGRARGYCS